MAHIELSTEYVGKVYNSDVSIDNIFQYERFFQNGQKVLMNFLIHWLLSRD